MTKAKSVQEQLCLNEGRLALSGFFDTTQTEVLIIHKVGTRKLFYHNLHSFMSIEEQINHKPMILSLSSISI